eukprot:IDg6754t1
MKNSSNPSRATSSARNFTALTFAKPMDVLDADVAMRYMIAL